MTISKARQRMLALGWGAALAMPHSARAQQAAGDEDAAIFRAVVSELARSPEGTILIDPRALDSGADLTSVDPHDVGAASSEREEVLERMGIRTTVFLADKPCMFAHGLPPAPEFDNATEEQRRVRQQCRARGPFTSVIVGGARLDGDTASVPVAQMTTSRYAARRFVLRRCGPGAWVVVRIEELVGVQS